MNETLYVVARNYQRYVHWCREKGYGPHGGSVKYVRDVTMLQGLYNVRVLCLRGWENRVDWREIHERILYIQRRPGGEL